MRSVALPLPLPLTLLAFLVALFVLTVARRARAQSEHAEAADRVWLDADQADLEEPLEDGDLDEEDLARIAAGAAGSRNESGKGKRSSGTSHLMAQTWVSLVGFERPLVTGLTEVGGFVVLGVALDAIAARTSHAGLHASASLAEDASPQPAPPAPRAPPPPASVRLTIDTPLARGAVRSAWRASGIEVNDARIDQMIARSRLSVLLPETRIRAMQVFQDGEHTTSYVNESGTIVDTSGSTTTLEARLTWRLDRLLFAGDEPTLERVRLEREEARARIGGKVLELLFAWQRSLLDEAASDAGSRAEGDAILRQYEAEISLDVLTAGWFGAQPLVRARRSRP